MANHDRNAAIFYAQDGYDPIKKGLNGRRVAGQSFLNGFLDHAEVDEFISFTAGQKSAKEFGQIVDDHPRQIPHRAVFSSSAAKMNPIGTLFYPSPNYAQKLWDRQYFGVDAYSICGITHTTASRGVMEGFLQLRMAPQMPWDAVICTSRAVHAATVRNIELADEYLKNRFGSVPAAPLLPVIPLGTDCAEFHHDPQKRRSFRKKHGWKKDDIVISTLARLLPHSKFDPLPLFVALQKAQEQLGNSKQLHFLACGIFLNDVDREIYENGVKSLMPDVKFTHVDGGDLSVRSDVLSASDIFTFMIDNIQETFGLAPVEAMAAGLPVVCSNWDGMRDTVTPDVGFLIPSRSVNARASLPEAKEFMMENINYTSYIGRSAGITSLDIQKMCEAFVTLAKNNALRKKMGKAGQERAVKHFDWAAIIPQMQDLWAEMAQIRKRNTQKVPQNTPVGPLPMDLFASYPSQIPPSTDEKFYATPGSHTLAQIWQLRASKKYRVEFEQLATLERVFDCLQKFGEAGATLGEISQSMQWNVLTVERAMLFFLKYDLAVSLATRDELAKDAL